MGSLTFLCYKIISLYFVIIYKSKFKCLLKVDCREKIERILLRRIAASGRDLWWMTRKGPRPRSRGERAAFGSPIYLPLKIRPVPFVKEFVRN